MSAATVVGSLLLSATLLAAAPTSSEPVGVKVIVHPSVAGTQIRKAVLGEVFLGRTTRWGTGEPIRAVDQSIQSPVRAAFSSLFLDQPVAAVQAYWARELMHGSIRPPVARASDTEVLAYVRENPGSIGYVSASASVDGSVKVVQVMP